MAILIIQTITLIITKREGILSQIPSLRLLKGALVIKKEDIGKIEQVLKKYKVKYEVYEITIPESKLITP